MNTRLLIKCMFVCLVFLLVACICEFGVAAEEESAAADTALETEDTEIAFDEESFKILMRLGESGFAAVPIDEQFAELFHAPVSNGLLLAPIPADRDISVSPSDLLPWDIIVEYEGKKISKWEDLRRQGTSSEANLKVYRKGKLISVNFPLGEPLKEEPAEEIGSRLSRFDEHIDEDIHVVYYMQGEEPWDGNQKVIEDGIGRIVGRITVSDKPVEGVQISLLLAGKQRTQTATTDADGRFEVHLRPGRYFYIGYALSGPNAPEAHMIPVDRKLEPFHMMKDDIPPCDGDKLTERFSELSAQHGPEKAAEMLAEESAEDFDFDPFEERYPLDVTASSAVELPDIVYREPIRIVTPMHKSSVSLDTLKFAWVPYENAASYEIEVCHITKKHKSTTFSPICGQTVSGNSIEASELKFNQERYFDEDDAFDENGDIHELTWDEWFGFQVFAYDKDGNLLSASAEHDYVEFFIK